MDTKVFGIWIHVDDLPASTGAISGRVRIRIFDAKPWAFKLNLVHRGISSVNDAGKTLILGVEFAARCGLDPKTHQRENICDQVMVMVCYALYE